MKVTQLAELLGAKVVCPADREIACGYSCDLLSWVMAHGKQDMAWVTVQAHLNVIAVASGGNFTPSAAITQDISASTATAITLRCACTVTHAISCLPCAITQLSKSHE